MQDCAGSTLHWRGGSHCGQARPHGTQQGRRQGRTAGPQLTCCSCGSAPAQARVGPGSPVPGAGGPVLPPTFSARLTSPDRRLDRECLWESCLPKAANIGRVEGSQLAAFCPPGWGLRISRRERSFMSWWTAVCRRRPTTLSTLSWPASSVPTSGGSR